ncbi:putative proline dehydrogenase [Rhodococcoides trifolii]|uniref:proline dehydrogenase n=1 Tax=Rhodococcoides trifolii TaxID=908250 RepID=A0A917G585_9NOCA|nr:proline dehydrogenase family protein [Rhodococcus trifolii]GGG23583.1 putative proline dehydrogenase [Rhodococcus trifolii]
MALNIVRPALLAAARSPKLEGLVGKSRVTKKLVDRFVPGSSETAVVDAARALLESGRSVSIDYLGEDTTDEATATVTVDAYLSLIRAYTGLTVARPHSLEVSIKLSALGQSLPGDGNAVALQNAHKICSAADAAGVWVTVDAEDHTTTDRTLAVVRELRKDFPSVGTVLQAYLKRTEADCREFAGPGSRIRLCKGAYQEPATVAFQSKDDVDASYLRCLTVLMEGDGYPMVASHDPQMIAAATSLGADRAAPFEFQMLYGIRDGEQVRLATEGHRVRVYTPYGDQWYGYFMRRLAERPANLTFFLRSLVSRS